MTDDTYCDPRLAVGQHNDTVQGASYACISSPCVLVNKPGAFVKSVHVGEASRQGRGCKANRRDKKVGDINKQAKKQGGRRESTFSYTPLLLPKR